KVEQIIPHPDQEKQNAPHGGTVKERKQKRAASEGYQPGQNRPFVSDPPNHPSDEGSHKQHAHIEESGVQAVEAGTDSPPLQHRRQKRNQQALGHPGQSGDHQERSEEHTSELQSRENLVCRLLLEKKKDIRRIKNGWHHSK